MTVPMTVYISNLSQFIFTNDSNYFPQEKRMTFDIILYCSSIRDYNKNLVILDFISPESNHNKNKIIT